MNRRDFLRRLGGAAAAVALSPMLDLAEILPAPEPAGFICHEYFGTFDISWKLLRPTRLDDVGAFDGDRVFRLINADLVSHATSR